MHWLFNFAAPAACEKSFLGLTTWWHYLPDNRFDGCTIRKFTLLGAHSDLPLVLLAIVDDLLRIAGIVAVVFVLIGAVRYVTSQGNPEDTAAAQSTVINALIGLVIAVVAIAFVSFLGSKLGS